MTQWVPVSDYCESREISIEILADIVKGTWEENKHYRSGMDGGIEVNPAHLDATLDASWLGNDDALDQINVLAWGGHNLVEELPKIPLVYVVRAGSFVKIGFALNVKKRIGSLQVGCPYDITLWGLIHPGRLPAYSIEGDLQYELRDYAIRGEWFSDACIPHLNALVCDRESHSRQ